MIKTRPLMWLTVACAVAGFFPAVPAFSDEKHDNAANQPVGAKPANSDGVLIEAARARAKITHDIYAATLMMLHDRYFHLDSAALPARAMQDVFDEIESQSRIEARWISASLKPMSIDHTPKRDFEKRASKEIAAGTSQLEEVKDGYYHRAIAIPLKSGCLNCHENALQNSTRKQFAGLVVSVPLRDESKRKGKVDLD